MTRWLLRMVVAVILGWQMQAVATAQGTMPPPGYSVSVPVPPQAYMQQAPVPQQGYVPAPPMQQQAIVPQQGYVQTAPMQQQAYGPTVQMPQQIPQQAYVPVAAMQQQVPQQGFVSGAPMVSGQPIHHDVLAPQQFGNNGMPQGYAPGSGPNGSGTWGPNSWMPYVASPPRYPVPPDPYYYPATGKVEGSPFRQAYLNLLNPCGTGCYASHNNLGCSSCYAQLVFVFGSCRQWFGTPCIPDPGKPNTCMDFLRDCLGGGGACGPNGCPGKQ